MTIQEFHTNFYQELDKTQDFEYPAFQPEQIDYWLNKAQQRFIESRLYPKDPRFKGFEGNQKRIDDLKSLVKKSDAITPVADGTIYYSQLPNDYLHLIRHWCITNDSTCGTKSVGGVQVQQDDLNKLLKDPFWRPVANEPLFYLMGNKIVYEQVVGFAITETRLNYIKKPVQMKLGSQYVEISDDIDCELDSPTHQEILDIAISMVLENIESQRYQTNLNELNKTE